MACTSDVTTLSTCGCCHGVTQETPETVTNRPGLSAIAYRVAAYPQFYETLLARITQSGQPSLRALKSRTPDDFTIALLDAFSVMGDVLTFYTERIANESYLRTATQRQSVRELANLVGYRMSPGVAASVYLAFTIDPTAGAFGTALTATINAQVVPELIPSVVIPVGTQVQSIPGPGQLPQTFETIEQIYARAEWNAMTPRLIQPQLVSCLATALLLSGSNNNVKVGDQLLLVAAGGAVASTPVSVQSVTVSSDGKTTEIDLPGWSVPNPLGPFGFSPGSGSFVDGVAPGTTAIPGTLKELQGAADVATAASMLADPATRWDAGDVVAAATANLWPLDQLAGLVNQVTAAAISAAMTTTPAAVAANGAVIVFRQQAAPFGYNSPNYYSLPASLTNATAAQIEEAPPSVTTTPESIPAAYQTAWDEPPSKSVPTGMPLSTWNSNQVYLDSVYSQIVAGSYVLLQNAAPSEQLVAQVLSNTTVTYSNFAMTGKVSMLVIQGVSGAADLSHFFLRTTVILCQGEALPLAQVPVTTVVSTSNGSTPPNSITLNGAYLGLLAGQQIVLSGTTLSMQGGVAVAGPVATEDATLEAVSIQGGYTTITLATALVNMYQRSSVTINANVANATNGSTVTETMGSGDGTQQFQSFVLHQAPLTYVAADTPAGSVSTLQVWVDSVQWTEVPYLYGHGPNEQIFVTSQDDNSVTTVMFGDGVTGSRLSTGTANVVAQYRYGIGTGGLVNGNQLSQLMSRPLGVRGVNNPLASEGAADPEDLNSGRAQATLAIMTLGRVVSLQDYQDFALSYVGIGKALATWTWNGQQRMVLLTVSGITGPVDAAVTTALQGSIALISEPEVQLTVVGSTPTYFNMKATVLILPSYKVATVLAATQSSLTVSFGYAAMSLGQSIFQSEVIAVMQSVPGVVDVTLLLYLSSDPLQTPMTQIAATVPVVGGRNEAIAASLIALDPGTLGITIQPVMP